MMPPLTKPTVTPVVRTINGVKRTDYCVYLGTERGRGRRVYRANHDDAVHFAADYAKRVKACGVLANRLDVEQTLDAANALKTLSDAGCTLTLADVCRQWLEARGGAVARVLTCNAALDRYMMRFDASLIYPQQLERSLATLIDRCGASPLTALRKDDVAIWLTARFVSPKTYNLNRGYALSFLRWAVKQNIYPRAQFDECSTIEKHKVPYQRPCFFNATTVENIMRWAERQEDADLLVPKFALGFFAGVRTAEIHRMKWRDIRFNDNDIRVESPKGRCGTPPRIVTMSLTLRAWMLKYQLEDAYPVCMDNAAFGRRKQKMCAELGIVWDDAQNRNVMRHTFAGAHVALYRDVFKTANELGHTHDVQMLKAHYWSAVEREDAERMMAIMPKEG